MASSAPSLAGVINDSWEVAARFADSPMGLRTWVHAGWVASAMLLATGIAIPIGLIASRSPKWERWLRRACDAISGVPALAWLAVSIAMLGGGSAGIRCFLMMCTAPALVRGVLDGVRAVHPALMEVAVVLGLPAVSRIRIVAGPLASRGILRGLREAVTQSSAATTVAAVVGAGGYGEMIVSGAMDGDPGRMLKGGLAVTAFTFAVRAMIAGLERASPPLVGGTLGGTHSRSD